MEDFAVCLFGITFIILLFAFPLAWRYLNYRETLALAEKGLVKPAGRNGKGALVWGILILAVGAALFVGLLPLGVWIGREARGLGPLAFFGPWMLAALIPMFFGIGLMLVYVVTREPKPKAEIGSPAPPAPQFPASSPSAEAARVEPPSAP